MKKILVTMMVLALTIAAQAQQYDVINTYTYDYGLSGRTTMLRATFSPSICKSFSISYLHLKR